MDWTSDITWLDRDGFDIRRVFKYQSRPSRVVKIVERRNYVAEVWSLSSPEDWEYWLEKSFNNKDRGLVLIFADRNESLVPHKSTFECMSIDEWLARASDIVPNPPSKIRRAATFAPLAEKSAPPDSKHRQLTQGQQPRGIRHLPFSEHTFQKICENFQIHPSIVRTITRSDVPSVSCDILETPTPSLVYTARTSNSWPGDLALSSTHDLNSSLNLVTLYGSSFTTEQNILHRLQSVRLEATHPLLMLGILAELELVRHKQLVDKRVNEVETRIFELNFLSGSLGRQAKRKVEENNIAKRTAWLELTYLHNSILSWNTQLANLICQTEMLQEEIYGAPTKQATSTHFPMNSGSSHDGLLAEHNSKNNNSNQDLNQQQDLDKSFQSANEKFSEKGQKCNGEMTTPNIKGQMQRINRNMKSRLVTIREEYDEKIRDCTMRVDGMAMATQWSHSETAVEIALATNQDSRVMRSISLVTMVFLPGTFFATVFSMTFFDWSGNNGATRVSSYLWIYVVVTVLFTGITIGLWYFFVIMRSTIRGTDEEKKLCLD